MGRLAEGRSVTARYNTGDMTFAVLPFNAAAETKPALARQLANYAAEIVRAKTGLEVNSVNYLVRLDDSPNPRFANVNAAEVLNEFQIIQQLFDQTQADYALDGLFTTIGEAQHTLECRLYAKGTEEAMWEEKIEFADADVFDVLRKVMTKICEIGEKPMEDLSQSNEEFFGTQSGTAFLKFLEGADAAQYIDKTQGAVAQEFNPELAFQALHEAIDLDKDWEAPYAAALQLSRLCTAHRIGTAEIVEASMKKLMEQVPEDERALIILAELYSAVGNHSEAANSLEKAIVINDKEPALYTRLGIAQMEQGMPVNAERNFRKAMEMEEEPKPSLDYLAHVMFQTGRGHEVPTMWQERVAASPTSGALRVKLAQAQFGAGSQDEAIATFESALADESVDEKVVIKRFYAPVLVEKNDLDRAMDFYEDCLDETPTDVQLMLEYAQTLQRAGRDFEIPKILEDVLAANPDANTRAQVMAWKLEIEQPKRVETIRLAQEKLEQEDFQGALRDLKLMKNWLSDYWKMWTLLAAAHNRVGEHEDAEQTSMKAIEMYPGCEPAYAELATALGAQGRNEEVYNAMRFGLGQVPNSLPIVVNLGLAAKRTGKEDEAKALAQQIREALGPNPELEPILAEMEGGRSAV